MKHGGRYTKEYGQWRGAKHRCHCPTAKDFPQYGGRGIVVCARWRDSFETFIADMGKCPDGMTLDRIYTNGPYSRENCRWATPSAQQRNKTNSVRLTIDGITFETITDAASHFGVSLTTINRWCDGFTDARRGCTKPPRPNCHKERAYP